MQEENLIERGREIAELLGVGLEGIAERTQRIAQIRRRGLMIALELEDDPAASLAARTHRQLLERGFIVARRPGLSVLRVASAAHHRPRRHSRLPRSPRGDSG